MGSDSSDSASSDDESKKEVKSSSSSSSEDEEEDLKKRPSRTTNSKTIIESGSDSGSGSDSDDESDQEASTSRKRPATQKRVPVNKRRRTNSDDDRTNRNLFETEDDYLAWKQMSEKDREQKIFELMELNELKKTREQITQKLKAKNAETTSDGKKKKEKKRKDRKRAGSDSDDDKSGKNSSDSEADAEFHRPSEMAKKRQQKSAMQDLLQKRRDKEKKKDAANKNTWNIDEVFGKDDKDDSDSSSSSSDSSSNSSRSSSSSRDSSPSRKASDDEETRALRKPVETKDELKHARLSRFKLSKFVHAPFFADVVTGGYVRIQTGPIPGSKSKYRIARIIGVVETAKVYTLENTRTNKGLNIKWGKHQRVYRLEFVSNTEWLDEEFLEWKEVTTQEDTIPNMDHVLKKEKEIAKAMNHNYKSSEVDAIIKEKGRFQKTPRNFAMTKGELMKKKEHAEQVGDIKLVQQLQREIEEVDQRAEQLDKARSADISAITWINQRNRNKMKENFLGEKVMFELSSQDDPFTRKKDRMKVVCAKGKPLVPTGSEEVATEATTTITETVTVTSLEVQKESKVHTSKSANDLFDLHKSIASAIDIDLGRLGCREPMPSRTDDFDHTTTMRAPPAANDNRRMVSLDDYRRRQAEKKQ